MIAAVRRWLFPAAEESRRVQAEERQRALDAADEVRNRALDEVQMLAPHEIGCRCHCGDRFDFKEHAERCPRRQIGEMVEGMR